MHLKLFFLPLAFSAFSITLASCGLDRFKSDFTVPYQSTLYTRTASGEQVEFQLMTTFAARAVDLPAAKKVLNTVHGANRQTAGKCVNGGNHLEFTRILCNKLVNLPGNTVLDASIGVYQPDEVLAAAIQTQVDAALVEFNGNVIGFDAAQVQVNSVVSVTKNSEAAALDFAQTALGRSLDNLRLGSAGTDSDGDKRISYFVPDDAAIAEYNRNISIFFTCDGSVVNGGCKLQDEKNAAQFQNINTVDLKGPSPTETELKLNN